jgi:hypothetical protein
MNSEVLRGGCELFPDKDDFAARELRSQLMNLTLDWELTALELDARRYRASEQIERESLRDSAVAYRKCIAELTGILSGSSLLACKP